jgi:hypothetical protein
MTLEALCNKFDELWNALDKAISLAEAAKEAMGHLIEDALEEGVDGGDTGTD